MGKYEMLASCRRNVELVTLSTQQVGNVHSCLPCKLEFQFTMTQRQRRPHKVNAENKQSALEEFNGVFC
jgi:hypothetical protein